MPRDAVAITALSVGAGVTNPAGVTITPGNGASIAGVGDTSRLVIRVTNTAGSNKNVTVKAGVNPPAPRAGLGDLVVAVPLTSGDKLIEIESARHLQADGSVNVDFETGMTGVISVVQVTKGA